VTEPSASTIPERREPAPLEWGDVIVIGGGCYGTFYVQQLERAAGLGRVRYQRLLVVDRNSECQVARELGARADREVVVKDWGTFLDDYLAGAAVADPAPNSLSARPPATEPPLGAACGDAAARKSFRVRPLGRLPAHIVPSPLMPHLMYEWLVRRARARWPGRVIETRPVSEGPGTPYDVAAPDGTRYLSFADWLCPTHCIEPAICPVIRGPRTWEMTEALERLANRSADQGVSSAPVLFTCRHQVFGVGAFGVEEVVRGDLAVAQAGAAGAPVSVLVGTISSCHGAVSLLHLGPA
jgi:hypothetical protein